MPAEQVPFGHDALLFWDMQPLVTSHELSVQTLPSSQFMAAPGTHELA